ncbi:MAG: SPOR domain-containing protein [Betaproteobacteria bacterium]|nr:SPOR domain-containing protein [Betaproteobacteria bacterium]
MAESEDMEILKRRGRRRLLGAIALVLLAVIVLPMVFDQEPGETSVPVSVRIPSEEAPPLLPKSPSKGMPQEPLPAAGAAKESSTKSTSEVTPGRAEVHADQSVAAQAAVAPPPAEQSKVSTTTKPPKANTSSPQFIIPVVALANLDKVKELTERLTAAKLPYYTEPVSTAKGPVTRVRVGPYDRREAAERAHRKLKELGLKPGAITSRSG